MKRLIALSNELFSILGVIDLISLREGEISLTLNKLSSSLNILFL